MVDEKKPSNQAPVVNANSPVSTTADVVAKVPVVNTPRPLDPLVVATLLAGYVQRWGAIQERDIPSKVADVIRVAREIDNQVVGTKS